MHTTAPTTTCRIHDFLDRREAGRVLRLLERVQSVQGADSACPLDGETDHLLGFCPYMRSSGPSSLCAERCHLHHLVFEENWP